MDRMMLELFGVDRASEGVRFAGGTDRAIVRALLSKVGRAHEADAHVDRALEVYLRHLTNVVTTRPYRPIGDVARTVADCAERGACVGLATGNVRSGAQVKLRSAGLADVFSLDRGGYGCDGELRPDILRAAVERCGGARSECEVVVVGDTMHDVTAARAIGARVVGVGTSDEARSELRSANADAIVSACGVELVAAIFG